MACGPVVRGSPMARFMSGTLSSDLVTASQQRCTDHIVRWKTQSRMVWTKWIGEVLISKQSLSASYTRYQT